MKARDGTVNLRTKTISNRGIWDRTVKFRDGRDLTRTGAIDGYIDDVGP